MARRSKEDKPLIPFPRAISGIKPYAVLMAEAQMAYQEMLDRQAQDRKGGRPRKGAPLTLGKARRSDFTAVKPEDALLEAVGAFRGQYP